MSYEFIDIQRIKPEPQRDTRENVDKIYAEDRKFFERHTSIFWRSYLAQYFTYCRRCKDKIHPTIQDILQHNPIPEYCRKCAELLDRQAECDHYFISDREYSRFVVYICENCMKVRLE